MNYLRVYQLTVQFIGPNPLKPLIDPELAHAKAFRQVQQEEFEKSGLDLFSQKGLDNEAEEKA